eukprot:GFYU01038354.1.p1 GENE.GFYU01038354.1~~GFYU01038354.1.p1  ORF type:complete len:106 (+),score=21.69 GFYU01038354.1:44-319(+)
MYSMLTNSMRYAGRAARSSSLLGGVSNLGTSRAAPLAAGASLRDSRQHSLYSTQTGSGYYKVNKSGNSFVTPEGKRISEFMGELTGHKMFS